VNVKQYFEYSDCTLTENLDDRLAERVKMSLHFQGEKTHTHTHTHSQQLKRGVISSDLHRIYDRKKVGYDMRISNA